MILTENRFPLFGDHASARVQRVLRIMWSLLLLGVGCFLLVRLTTLSDLRRAWAQSAKQVRRLAVLNREDRLVGIVSLGDLAVYTRDEQLSGKVLEQVSEPAEPDR